MLYVEFSESFSLSAQLCDKWVLSELSTARTLCWNVWMPPQLHTSGHTPSFVKKQMSTEKAWRKERITFCFLLLGKPLQYPPTQVLFALQRGSCKEHRCYCFPHNNSSQKRLCLHIFRDNHSPRKCCQIIGPNCVNTVVFTQTIPGMTEREVVGSPSTRVETYRKWQSSHPTGKKQLMVRMDPPWYRGGSS